MTVLTNHCGGGCTCFVKNDVAKDPTHFPTHTHIIYFCKGCHQQSSQPTLKEKNVVVHVSNPSIKNKSSEHSCWHVMKKAMKSIIGWLISVLVCILSFATKVHSQLKALALDVNPQCQF